MRAFQNRIMLTACLLASVSPAYADAMNVRGEYLYGPETSEADACRLAMERAKVNALSKVFGESISMEEQMSCREVRGSKPDYGCELNRVSWSLIEGEIGAVTNYRKELEVRAGERACIVMLTADVVIPNRKTDSNFDLKATLNEKVYRTGDVLTISIEPTVPMHIAIFNWVPYQDRDTVTQMFPNPMDPQSHITKKTNIPTENKSSAYNFTMTWLESLPKNKTFVDEYLIVIGTKNPIKWLSSYEFSDFKLKLREIPLDEMRVSKRGYQLIRGPNKLGSVQ